MPAILCRLLILLALTCAAPCFAQAPPPAAAPAPAPAVVGESAKSFDDARQQIADIRKKLAGKGELEDAQLAQFRDAVAAIGAQADATAADRTPKLAAIEARLAELGPAPAKGGSEAADIAAQRADLDKQRSALDAEIKRARLLSVDSQQLTGTIAEARRASFQATLSRRTDSPLGPAFWSGLGESLDRDGARVGALREGLLVALKDAFAVDNRAFAIGGLCLGLLLIVLGRWSAERALLRLTADRMPQGPLRRSAHALAVVVVTTVFTGFGVKAIVAGLDWHGAFSDAEATFAQALVAAAFYGSFVAGLGRALLSAARPSWRLPPISDATAERLRRLPLLFGLVVGFSVLQKRVNSLLGTSLAATIAGSLLVALLYGGLIGWALLRAGRSRAAAAEESPRRPLWLGLAMAALWLGVIATFAAALSGYVALAQQIARQMMGLGLVAATAYLLVHLIEDACATLASTHAPWAQRTLAVEPRVLQQAAVLCSGLLRVVVLVLVLIAVLAPFGTEPADILARFGQSGATLRIGQIELTPGALVGAIVVFVLGLAVIRTVQRWLLAHYLPTTRLDPAMRSSVTTLLGYAGGVVVFAFALSALGLGLERIAWVASALVGRHRLRPAGDRAELRVRADPAGRAPGQGRRLGRARRHRGRHPPHQRARDRDPDRRPLDRDRAELGTDHQERAQRDPRQRARARAHPSAAAARRRRRTRARPGARGVRRAPDAAGDAGAERGAGRHRGRRADPGRGRLRAQSAPGRRRAQRPVVRHPGAPARGRHQPGNALSPRGARADRCAAAAGERLSASATPLLATAKSSGSTKDI